MDNKKVRPFLKWAGGKYCSLKHIIPALPAGRRLIEPFVGAGSVFLNTDYKHYLLNDINPDLINLYNTLKNEGDDFIKFVKKYFNKRTNDEIRYYKLREKFNKTDDERDKAALFLYLNRHGYNGLCRYNNSGKFNVPYGRIVSPYFPEKEMIQFTEKAQHATFTCHPFAKSMQKAKEEDVLYCDPPYVPLTESAYFTQYSTISFPLEHQHELAEQAKQLADNGISVVLSNHDTPLTRKIYRGAKITSFPVSRTISCKIHKRKPVKELLAVY